MAKITPHLWYDTQAKEAAQLYSSTFPNSRVTGGSTIHDTPSGDCDIVQLEILGQPFQFISAGPLFKFNPSISFMASFVTAGEVEAAWHKLLEGGSVMMPLDSYPWSPKYGWLADRFGLSWQLIHQPEPRQAVTPTLMFTGQQAGRAEQAMQFYTRVFGGQINNVMRYGEGEGADQPGTVKHASFTLDGTTFACMDSAHPHGFTFNEAISFMVNCSGQAEVDRYWDQLSAVPEAEQCGWLKDQFGVSWQVVPAEMGQMLNDPDPARVKRVTEAFLKMKKFDLAGLAAAYQG